MSMSSWLGKVFGTPYLYICIIALGIGLKFYGLESKFFWLDEVFTVTHTTGIKWEKFVESVPGDSLYSISEFNGFLDLNNGKYRALDQFKGLSEMVQLTPLHYFLLVVWHRVVGGDFLDYRLFSVFFFLLSLPLLYLLAFEISKSKRTAWIAVSLFSVAPFFHFYAQEARYFVLWSFSLILANLLLLKALDQNGIRWWIGYGLSLVLAVYISALSPLLFVGHFLFVWFFVKAHRLRFALASASAMLCYLPWMILMYQDQNAIFASTSWQVDHLEIWQVLLGPWFGMANTFYTIPSDIGTWAVLVQWDSGASPVYQAVLIQTVIVVLIGLAIYHLAKTAPKQETWFLLLNIIPIIIFFYAFDLIADRTTSMVYRYHFILGLAVILFLSWYMDRKMKAKIVLFASIYAFVLAISILSSIRISKDPCYNNIGLCKRHLAAAEILSADAKPLVITDAFHAFLLFFWDITIACDSDDIDVLYQPDGEKLYDYLTSKEYSNIYFTKGTSEVKFGLIKAYKQDSINRLPLAINLDTYAAALVSDPAADVEKHRLDITADMHTYDVTFQVNTLEIPETDTVFITGNHYSIGDSDPHKVPMQYMGAGHWQIVLPIESNFDLEYRFTLGNWNRQMADSTGYTYDNYSLKPSRDTSVLSVIPGWEDN